VKERIVKIRVIVPVITKRFEQMTLDEFSAAARPDVEVSVVSLDRGPASIESAYDEALAVPDIVAKIVQAEKDGMDAVISDCMGDPGIEEAREKVSIPVVGPAETSMHMAAMLGHRYSVITVLDRLAPGFHQRAMETGTLGQLASVRAVNMPVLELDDHARLSRALIEQSVKAVREDDAHVIIFGCTGMAGLAKDVGEGLKKEGMDDVPVIDPAILALKVAEALADMGLSHSKRTYPAPPEKEIIGY
jgi:allantoin racemase